MILVFVGAGGAAAVDPEQYPATEGFFNQLPREIKDHHVFREVCEFITARLGKKQIDIEDVLGVLDELQADYRKIADGNTPLGWSLAGRFSFAGCDPGQFPGAIESFSVGTVVPLASEIKERIYGTYGRLPEQKKLLTWIEFLRGLEQMNGRLEIFTTNYDLILEEAVKQAGLEVELGLVDDARGRTKVLRRELWNEGLIQLLGDEKGLLTKLHGSVDWHYLNGEITVGPPRYTGNHGNHCLLHPGYKGVPTEDPFFIFHRHFRNLVRGAYDIPLTAAVFIGFAFRDDYINTILEDLPFETLLISVTDGEVPPPDIPRVRESKHIGEGFTQKTARLVLSMIAESMI